jgi:uncharacterized protein (DUF2249 family)
VAEPGPTSLPYVSEESSEVRNKQRQLIQQLQEAFGEKQRPNHRSSGDLAWRLKVRARRHEQHKLHSCYCCPA